MTNTDRTLAGELRDLAVLLATALHDVRVELWSNFCLQVGVAAIDKTTVERWEMAPHIRIIDGALAQHANILDRAVLPYGVTDEMVERALDAWNASPDLVNCQKCEGSGYHHGFGEGGVDPDWCTVCGGSGYDIPPDAESTMMRHALTAALPGGGWRDIATAPQTSSAILVWCAERRNTFTVSYSFYDARWIHFGGRGFLDEIPTHWMPLPSPPNTETYEGETSYAK
jgi:hypothetical protein